MKKGMKITHTIRKKYSGDSIMKPWECRCFIKLLFRHTDYEDDRQTGVIDLLADLMHYADQEGLNFKECLRIARNHFEEEKGGRKGVSECRTSLTEMRLMT